MTTNTQASLNVSLPVPNTRPFYTRLTALGFGLIALTGLVVLGVSLATGTLADNGGFGIAFLVMGLLVTGLVWRWGRWALIVAAVLSFLLLALAAPFELFSLGHPESAVDFVPTALSLAGALVGFVGSVVASLQWRRKTPRAAATQTERRALGGFLGVLAGSILVSLVLTLASHTTLSAEAKAGATSMQIHNFAFAPSSLLVGAGETVRLVVKNDDATLHTFTFPQAGIDVSVPPGAEKVIEFKAPAAGSYQWFCIPHSSVDGATRTGMVGSLVSR